MYIIYVYVAIDMKKSRERVYWRAWGEKGKEERCNYIIISKNKRNLKASVK